MIESTTHGWLKMFPALNTITDDVWHRIMRSAQHVVLPAGSAVFRGGQACENYLLVLEGMVKVQRVSEDGHEIILYRIGAGQVCELTTSCLLADAEYPAEAVAETAVRAILIPKAYFHEALSGSPGFRKFVFSSLDQGIHGLVHLVEEVAFGHMDCRLAQHLLDLGGAPKMIEKTHYDLAVELGTAREVVSRLLKEFERRGWVRLHRGKIEIVGSEELRALAEKGHV